MNEVFPDVVRGAVACVIAIFAGLGAFQIMLRAWKKMRLQRPRRWSILAGAVGLLLVGLNYLVVGLLVLGAFSAALYILSFVVQCPDHSILTSRPGQTATWFKRAAWAAFLGCLLGLSAWTSAELFWISNGRG
ncbi:hypothetical protein M3O57_11800 [Xanthomonas nasturtii]|uniref:hypothetical protein n=1 Tax=Xanthomonas nasturtii TaxID=1843581 RepID=UPI0011C049E7|nr:hypothetical protein [Xanthomonas nasturtii]MCL1500291.1 hypothetical protein [Xanthomonas nasturtii]MCL1505326.1 hypothetical protein [Xanthomonas nasturtii]MCL1523071.1 hypothetical protein [Xanthomonas nasturtii]MCL1530974.1 hypothetical protein [Xanthomonas nasturtii]MCL1565797.1 hypothetical protein [Xanthomonas nasturtii]